MPNHIYIPSSSILFEENFEEGNIDSSGQSTSNFRSRFPPLQQKPAPHKEYIKELGQKRQLMLTKKHEIEQRTLDSASRSVGLLHDSEKIGITTAEELVRQREILNITDKRLDNINPVLNDGDKHLKSVNSLFYNVKKYFFGKSGSANLNTQNMQRVRNANPTSRRLKNALNDSKKSLKSETNNNYSSHPSTRLRDLDQQLESNPVTNGSSVNVMLLANLNEMGYSIARLKNIGEALGEEINEQNKLLDTIHDKVDEAGIKIHVQNKVMNQLLRK